MSTTEKTVTVRRGGSYLTIVESSIPRYMAKGYDVVDEADRVIQGSVPNDVNTLKKAYSEHVAKIKELEAKIAVMKASKTQFDKMTKPAKVEEPEQEVEVIKTTTRNKKSL